MPADPTPNLPATRRPLRALIVDDDAFDRKRLSRMISSLPVPVDADSAASLEDLRRRVAETEYDIIFVDYGLTDGTGLDALKIVRSTPETSDVACVMVTGESRVDVAVACFRDGCRDYITKSDLSRDELSHTLERLTGEVLPPERPQASVPALTGDVMRELAEAVAPVIEQAVERALQGLPYTPPHALEGVAMEGAFDADQFIFASITPPAPVTVR